MERFKERLNIKIIKKANVSEDGESDDLAAMAEYVYDNTTSKECNDIMRVMEKNPITGYISHICD